MVEKSGTATAKLLALVVVAACVVAVVATSASLPVAADEAAAATTAAQLQENDEQGERLFVLARHEGLLGSDLGRTATTTATKAPPPHNTTTHTTTTTHKTTTHTTTTHTTTTHTTTTHTTTTHTTTTQNTTTTTTPTTTTATAAPVQPSFEFNSTVSAYFLPPALPGLAIAFVGYRYIGVTLFIIGAIFSSIIFYTFSPQVFVHTKFCCGENGTLEGKIIATCIFGFLCGLLTRFLYSIGLFFIGVSMGLITALAIHMTPLQNVPAMQARGAVIGLYVSAAVIFGFAATYFRKFFTIITTSLGGSLLFLLGVEYFARTEFGSIVLYCLKLLVSALNDDFIKDQKVDIKFNVHVPTKAYVMIGGWALLTCAAVFTQYASGERANSKHQEIIYRQRGAGRRIRQRNGRKYYNLQDAEPHEFL